MDHWNHIGSFVTCGCFVHHRNSHFCSKVKGQNHLRQLEKQHLSGKILSHNACFDILNCSID